MSGRTDTAFAVMLLGGLAFSVLVMLTAGALARVRLPRVRLPRLNVRMPRLRMRLPRLRLPRVRAHVPHAAAAQPSAAPPPAGPLPAQPELAFFPPGTAPMFLGVLSAFVGAVGMLCRHSFGLGEGASWLIASTGGPAGTVVVAIGLWAYFLRGQELGEMRSRPLVGTYGRVSVAIPADGVGAVAYVTSGTRAALPARSALGRPLAAGTTVVILDIDGHTAVVDELDL